MFTGLYELVIIWNGGDKDITVYESEKDAQIAELNMRKAFGNQIDWSCVRRQYNDQT